MIGVTKEYIFNNPADFTFDNTKSAITDKLRLRDIIAYHKSIYGSTFFANYETDINGLWANGVLTGTPTGGATVGGGKLDLKAWGKYVSYDALNNADSQQQGCIEVEIIPDWSGAGANRTIMVISRAVGNNRNQIQITQWNNGQLKVIIFDKDGLIITNQLLSVWNPVQGQPYTFSLDWDITAGQTILRINGTQHGITMTGTGLRDSNIGLLRIGADYNGANTVNAEINNFLIFSTVQHISDYVPDWSGVPIDVLSKNTQKIAVKDIFKQDELFEVSAPGLVEPANTRVRGCQRVNGQAYWYNVANSQIEPSDESIDQANTLAEYEEYLTEKYDPPQNTQLVVLIKSDDGLATPEVEKIIFKYSYTMEDYTKDYCEIDQDAAGFDGVDEGEIELKVRLVNPSGKYKNLLVHEDEEYYVSVDGKLQFNLLKTEDMGSGAHYSFSWIGDSGTEYELKKIVKLSDFGSTVIELDDYTG
jgi:hypothetical protein